MRALLEQLESVGFTLKARGGKLIVSPASRLTPPQRASITRHRDELLALVAGEAATPCLDAYEPRFDAGPVELARVAVVDVFGVKVVVRADEHEDLCRRLKAHNDAAMERWRKLTQKGR